MCGNMPLSLRVMQPKMNDVTLTTTTSVVCDPKSNFTSTRNVTILQPFQRYDYGLEIFKLVT